jgi:hypothetical protein
MSKVKIEGNASGTGIFTVAAPAGNTNRTITLPDNGGNLVTTGDSATITNTMIANNAISESKILNGAITTSKLNDLSVLASKIDVPYQMVVRSAGYTVPDGTNNIVYDVLVHNRYTSHNSGVNMLFEVPGKYLITTGWRFGSGGDVWTNVRLQDSNGTTRGIGFGTGQVVNDPGPCQISFIANIPADRINQNMHMQFQRSGSSMGIGNPAFGYAIVTTVIWCGV